MSDKANQLATKLGEIQTGVDGLNERQTSFEDLMTRSQATIEALEGRITGVEDKIKERRLHDVSGAEDEDPSWAMTFRGMYTGDWKGAEKEREIFSRGQEQATDSKGGYLVPIQQMSEPIEALRANSVLLSAGATTLAGLKGGNVEIPKVSGTVDPTSKAEGASIDELEYSFGELSLSEKMVAGIVVITKKALRNATPALDAFLKQELFRDLSLKMDKLGLIGSGSSNEPTGVVNQSDIKEVEIGDDGGNFTNETLIDMEGAIEDANAMPNEGQGRMGVIWHPGVKRVLKKQRIHQFSGQTEGFGYVNPPISDQALADYLGYSHYRTTQLRSNLTKGNGSSLGEVLLGDWSQVLWALWGTLEFEVSEHYKWGEHKVALKIVANFDIGLRHPEAICLVNDANTVYG